MNHEPNGFADPQGVVPLPASSTAEVEAWIAAAQGGCAQSLEKLLAECRNYLWTIAQRELPADLRAKLAPSDMVQETLIEAHRDFVGFEGVRSQELLAWLRRIMLNNLANARRKFRETDKRDVAREVPLEGFERDGQQAVSVPHADPSPSSVLCAHEEARRVEQAVDNLPVDYRQVIVLRHRKHLPFAEVAARMGRSEEAARKLWSRAIERLQEVLGIEE